MTKSNQALGLSLAALVVIFVAFLIAVWQTPIFDFEGTDARATVVAAALTLIGGLFATVITGAGLVLKHAIDIRTESRLRLDSERNAVLQTEAEQRLTLEAGIKAVQLLATSTGQPAPQIQVAGALFSLVSLRQHDLAAELVFGLLEANQIRPEIVSGVLEGVISPKWSSRRDSEETNRAARERLQDIVLGTLSINAERMLTKTGVSLPDSLLNGTHGLSAYSRARCCEILARTLVARPLSEWNQENFGVQANALVAGLCLCWLDEGNPENIPDVSAVLWRVLSAYPNTGVLYHPRETIDVASIRRQLDESKPVPNSSNIQSLALRIEAWARGERLPSQGSDATRGHSSSPSTPHRTGGPGGHHPESPSGDHS